ncbi:helix-turn-helix domain-containing protein [Rhizobium sp. LjRoot254]|uniref:helix-turn-helix domain-containing protein n=1 Tax=Rhizobium sp. LjRoot254 TaxID=3342297 RepID=UPI003ECF1FB0
MTPFGEAVRRIRRKRGITQKEMAKALNVSPAYLSALESGKRGKPGFDFLQRVAGYLNIIWDEADDLFRVAAISHPRVVVDTSGLPPDYTAFANRLAGEIRTLPPQTIRELSAVLANAAKSREKRP